MTFDPTSDVVTCVVLPVVLPIAHLYSMQVPRKYTKVCEYSDYSKKKKLCQKVNALNDP